MPRNIISTTIAALALCGVLGTARSAMAQQVVVPCSQINRDGACQSVSSGAPLPVQSSAGASVQYTHIATNTTTTLKSASGVLHAICVNTPGATDTTTVYDSTSASGTIIGVLSAAAAGCIDYQLRFANGLTIVTSGTTAPDLTVIWE
jgi:hypothetical protein